MTTPPAVARMRLAPAVAWQAVEAMLASAAVRLLSATTGHAAVLAKVVEESGASGNLVHDAHIWMLCLEHGVGERLSGDRDFVRFCGLKVRNPFPVV